LESKSKPKASFSTQLPNGDRLELAVWTAKSNPAEEALAIKVDRFSDSGWKTIQRMAFYRTKDGNYRQLPDRRPLSDPGSVHSTGTEAPTEDLFDISNLVDDTVLDGLPWRELPSRGGSTIFWIFSNQQGAEALVEALEKADGKSAATARYCYRFSRADKKFVHRIARTVESSP
jgi:hypothetical protein